MDLSRYLQQRKLMGKGPCTEPVSPSSELSVLPVYHSLLQQRSPAQLSTLTARTMVKQNTIHRHPDCTTCQLNLSKRACSEYCTPLRVNDQGGQAKRNVMQPHVPSVKVPHRKLHDGKPSGIPATHEDQALLRGSNTKDSRPYHR